MSKIWIVGGGLSGLTTAYYLTKAGHRPTLVEQQPRLGGLLKTSVVHGAIIEEGPDSFLATKPWLTQLMRELGLEEEAVDSNDSQRLTYIVRNGKLHALPEGFQMVAPTKMQPIIETTLLGWPAKLRMGLEYFRHPQPQRERSVAEFIRDHYGVETLDYIVEPLLSGVYGGDPEQLSARAVLPRFVEFERKYGSVTRGAITEQPAKSGGAMFKTMRSGWGKLVEALEAAIAGKINRVTGHAYTVQDNRLRVDGMWHEFEQLVLACPAFAAGEILAEQVPSLARKLNEIPYTSAMTVALGFNSQDITHPLNGFGFLVPAKERRRVGACTWVNSKFPHRVPEGQVVIRCFLGSGTDGGILHEPDEVVRQIVLDELRDLMGISAEPVYAHYSRWPRSMPQYTVGHEARVTAILAEASQQQQPKLWITGNAYQGIGLPDTVRMARDTAAAIGHATPIAETTTGG